MLFLTSCTDNMNNYMSAKFYYLDGVESKVQKVKKDETINVDIKLNVTKGEVYITLEDEDDNEIFKTYTSDTFEFTAESDTMIKATVHAEKASGSYKVTFEK